MSSAPCTGVVVLVEDDDDARELLQAVLERRGYRVATARDGIEGLALLHATERVCFVLVDLFMPRMDGFGLLLAMAGEAGLSELTVCVSTSAPHLAPNGKQCLPKPTDLERLFAMLGEHCREAS